MSSESVLSALEDAVSDLRTIQRMTPSVIAVDLERYEAVLAVAEIERRSPPMPLHRHTDQEIIRELRSRGRLREMHVRVPLEGLLAIEEDLSARRYTDGAMGRTIGGLLMHHGMISVRREPSPPGQEYMSAHGAVMHGEVWVLAPEGWRDPEQPPAHEAAQEESSATASEGDL